LLRGGNKIGDAGAAALLGAISSGALPACKMLNIVDNEASEASQDATEDAIAKRT
jgi:hypothetical protein